jgi:restriction system protein
LACGTLWTVSKGLQTGDVVLCPNGKGQYHVGTINGGYYYQPGDVLPHRRPVTWQAVLIDRSAMSQPLRNSTGSILTVAKVSGYRKEIEQLLAAKVPPSAY